MVRAEGKRTGGRMLATLLGGLLCGGVWAQERNLVQLLPALDSPEPTVRLAALYQIADVARAKQAAAERRDLAALAGPRLAKAASDADPRVQQAALTALGRLGVDADIAAPAYAQGLLAMDAKIRQIPAQAATQHLKGNLAEAMKCDVPSERMQLMAQWLHDAARLAPIFATLLADRDEGIRAQARAALDESWQQLNKLAWLGGADDARGRDWRQELAKTATAWAELAPKLGPHLQSGPEAGRLAAGQALESLARLLRGWEKQALNWSLTPAQTKELRSANQALAALSPSLVAVLPEAQHDVQLAVLGAIEAMESDADAARPQLLELCVSSKSAFVRWSCLRILTPVPAPTGEDWTRLAPLLQDDDADVRTATLRLFAAWAAEPAVPETAQAGFHAPSVHGTFDRKACVTTLANVLDQGSSGEQELALQVLGRLGEEAVPALPQIKVLIPKAKLEVRRLIPDTLRQIGRPALPALDLCLSDSDEETRLAAARAIQKLSR